MDKILNVPLVTNDKAQATKAKYVGIKASYLIEEARNSKELLGRQRARK